MIEELKKLLINDEGEVNHAYQDSEGYWTIGVGRLIDERKGGGITHDEAMYLLDNDIVRVMKECQRELPWFHLLDDARQTVVISMVFNMGMPNFKGFKKTIKYIRDHEFEKASAEMLDSKWASQVGARATRLSEIMKTGKYRG
jgi:lysozyme